MTLTPDQLRALLPFFIDKEFPKGTKEGKARGHAIVHVALFIQWLKENVGKK